ncbi:MAG: NTP transferase domain-containing protein [Robiginitalea sp.]|jgi:molybdopterin-guanine dinucleotide biosynthesis protein A
MNSTAKLYGLVLSGGKSTRMGTDKGLIDYHGIPQREYLHDLLSRVCDRTFISLRKDQTAGLPENMEAILDEDQVRGPFNGLLSAHNRFPDVAWLVLACDLPLMDLRALKELVAARNPGAMATAFAKKDNPLPEPMVAIWEPHAFPSALSYLQNGPHTCPRKFLINHSTVLVHPANENVLWNANSKEEYEEALEKLSAR